MRSTIKSMLFFVLVYIVCQDHIIAQNEIRWRWARTGTDATVDLSVSDTLGNTVVFGKYTTPEFSIGNVSISGTAGAPSDNLYLAKYTSTGALIWLKKIAGTVINTVLNPVKVVTNTRGDIIILGTAINTPGLQIDNRIVNFSDANEQMFIAKFHKAGRLLWTKVVQVKGELNTSVIGNDIDMNDAGEVFVTGSFNGDSAKFNSKWIPGQTTDPIFFLAKYSTWGLVDWVTSCGYDKSGDNGSISGQKIAVSNANEVTVAGKFSGYRDFYLGSDTLSTMGGTDVFIAHYTQDGTIRWAREIKGIMDEQLEQLVVDNASNILVAGLYNSPDLQVVDEIVLNSSNGFDLYIAKIKPDGATNWVQNIDIKLQMMDLPGIKAILHTDEITDVYIATLFQGAEVLVNTLVRTNVEPGTADLLFVKLEGQTGTPIWSRTAAAIGENWFNSVVFDRFSNIYFTADINTGSTTIDVSTVKDTLGYGGGYIAKINQLGDIAYTRPVLNKDSNNLIDINAISVDFYGNLYVSGVFQGINNMLDDLPLTTITGGIYTAKYAYITSISGQVKDADGSAVTHGYVKLFGYTRFQRSPISDSVTIGAGGYYLFNRIPYGYYIVYAKAVKADYPNSTPTYYPSEGHWADATRIVVGSTIPITGIDIIINMPEAPPGTGSLGGNIFETDSIIGDYKSTLSILKQPAKEVSVVLVNKKKDTGGDVVAVVYTDDNGDFIISGIADGDYTLIVDIPGLPHSSYYDITVTGGQYIGNLDYEVGLEEIYLSRTTGMDDYLNPSAEIQLYPNPCSEEFSIRIYEKSDLYGLMTVEFYNVTGQLFQSILIEDTRSVNAVNTKNLKPGIYLIRIGLSGTSYFFKMIKL